MQKSIFTGKWGKCHIQGIAADIKGGYIYYSFTTKLVKATLDGEIVGFVDGLIGHLGCIAFNENDGCVYGSLEYKNDRIGKGIMNALARADDYEDGFYVARFEVDRIDRPHIPAENGDIMTCVYLGEVLSDYSATVLDEKGNEIPHRYGCSGIDGLTFAPLPASVDRKKKYLYVAYGVYGDEARRDNDNQVLLCYDTADWDKYFAPLCQADMHRKGPSEPLHKYFVYTGNTRYGVQNLEYDREENALFMAVYKGSKKEYPNFDLYICGLDRPAEIKKPHGLNEEMETLELLPLGEYHGESGVWGWRFPYGATGLCSLGGDLESCRNLVQLLEGVANLQGAIFQSCTYSVHKVFFNGLFDDNDCSTEACFVGIKQRIIQNGFSLAAHRVDLLKSAVTASHSGCHHNQYRSFHKNNLQILFLYYRINTGKSKPLYLTTAGEYLFFSISPRKIPSPAPERRLVYSGQ